MTIEIPYVAVVAAAVVSMAVGFLWYGPLLGKMWMKEKGLTPDHMKEGQKELGKVYGISFVLALVTGYMLAHVMAMSQEVFGYAPVATGFTSAFSMWLGFVMPTQCTATLFGGKNWKLFGIDTGYQLASLLAMGIVIGLL